MLSKPANLQEQETRAEYIIEQLKPSLTKRVSLKDRPLRSAQGVLRVSDGQQSKVDFDPETLQQLFKGLVLKKNSNNQLEYEPNPFCKHHGEVLDDGAHYCAHAAVEDGSCAACCQCVLLQTRQTKAATWKGEIYALNICLGVL